MWANYWTFFFTFNFNSLKAKIVNDSTCTQYHRSRTIITIPALINHKKHLINHHSLWNEKRTTWALIRPVRCISIDRATGCPNIFEHHIWAYKQKKHISALNRLNVEYILLLDACYLRYKQCNEPLLYLKSEISTHNTIMS